MDDGVRAMRGLIIGLAIAGWFWLGLWWLFG